MAKAKKTDVMVPDAPDDVPPEITQYNADARDAAVQAQQSAKPCITCGSTVLPGQVCVVDGQKAE